MTMSREILIRKDRSMTLDLSQEAAYADKTPYELWQQTEGSRFITVWESRI